MKSKRVIICMAMAIVLVFALAAPALAASPIAGSGSVTDLPAGVTPTLSNIYSSATADAARRQIGLSGTQYIAGVFSVSVSRAVPNSSYGIYIPLAGLTSTPVVYRQLSNGGWEAIPTSYVNGTVIASITNIAVAPGSTRLAVVANSTGTTPPRATTPARTTTGTTATAPKTGGPADMSALLLVVLALGAVGAVYAGRKAMRSKR